MIREVHLRDGKIRYFDTISVQDEVQFLAWRPARIRRQTIDVRAAQICGFHEQVYLVLAPERIEISGNDYWFIRGDDEVVQMVKLSLTMPIFQR